MFDVAQSRIVATVDPFNHEQAFIAEAAQARCGHGAVRKRKLGGNVKPQRRARRDIGKGRRRAAAHAASAASASAKPCFCFLLGIREGALRPVTIRWTLFRAYGLPLPLTWPRLASS